MRQTLLSLVTVGVSLTTAFAQDRIYYGDQNADKIGSVTASDLASGLTHVSGTTGFNPDGVAYYHSNPTYPLFYAANTVIYRDNLAGSSNQIITPTGQFNRGLAIDYTGKKIYWANSANGYIGSANLDGSNKNEGFLTNLNTPYDVEIDPVNQKIYWCEADASGAGDIRRANLADGSNIEVVVENVYAQGLAVDPLRRKIFYTVFRSGANVHSVNLDGTGAIGPITTLTAIADIDVDVSTGVLYMIDYGSSGMTRAHPDGSNKKTVAVSGSFLAFGDVTTPVISSIVRQSPSTPSVGEGGTATFRVTFSEPVLHVDASDFEFSGTANAAIAVNPVSLHTVFDVVAGDITGTGTLDLHVAAGHDLVDFRGNAFGGTITAEETFNVITAPTPVIASFDPVSGPVGATVTITGTGFNLTPSENIVTFNNVTATVTASTSTTITTTVPADATTGALAVTTYGLTGTSANHFTVCAAPPLPTITREENVLTSSADAGNQWLKEGAEITAATDKHFVVNDPGNYSVRVSAGACASVSDQITITEAELAPDIIDFSPQSGMRGATVLITGTDFSATPTKNSVGFNGITAVVTGSTLTSITTTVPATAPLGAGPVTVTVNGRTATSSTSFTVLCSPPSKPTITTEGGVLTSSSNENNQWLKNGVAISGATNKTYTATTPGAYSVKVTVDGCAAESDPTTVVGNEEMISSSVEIYPNPANARVHIRLPTAIAAKVEVLTVTGVKKQTVELSPSNGRSAGELDLGNYPAGMYVIMISAGNSRVFRKVWKQ